MDENIRNAYKKLVESKYQEALIKARENPAIAVTKEARLRISTKTHDAIRAALGADRIVTVRARKTPNFEAPAVDHHLLNHQGALMLVDPKGVGRAVAHMAPSDTGHIAVQFKEKGRRVSKPVYLHAGIDSEGDFIETGKDDAPYRVALVGGKAMFKGLPDMNENFQNESDKIRIMNRLEEAVFPLNKKKIDNIRTAVKGTLGGLALAGAVISGHKLATQKPQQPTPVKQQVTAAISNAGSGKVAAPVKQDTAQSSRSAHQMAARVIQEREGFRSSAYRAPEGKWTIGYGNTRWSDGREVKPGDTITKDQAVGEFEHHIKTVVMPRLEKIPTWGKMSEHQRAALTSFAFNAGEHFYGSKGYQTLTSKLSDPTTWHEVPSVMGMYVKAHNPKTGKKETLPGLVTRRKYEGELWSGKEPELNR